MLSRTMSIRMTISNTAYGKGSRCVFAFQPVDLSVDYLIGQHYPGRSSSFLAQYKPGYKQYNVSQAI